MNRTNKRNVRAAVAFMLADAEGVYNIIIFINLTVLILLLLMLLIVFSLYAALVSGYG